MIRKTYGVPGKIETVMIVKAGQTDVHINFKGGSIVDFARKPASYATSDPLHQAIIENSVQFRRGEIKLMSTIEIPDDDTTLARKVDVSPVVTSEEDTVEGQDGDADGEQQNGELQTIEVACKADAVEWLKEKYPEKGYNGSNLRGKDAFEAACNEAGVQFIIAND